MFARFLNANFKLIIIVTILFFLNNESIACDGCRADFCYYAEYNKSEFVFYGEVLAIDSNCATIKLIDIYRGNETRSIIKVCAHKDSVFAKGTSCEELIRMSNIFGLGKINERIIIGLNKITVKENEWDITGEYRLPYKVNNTPWLIVENDSVKGLISGGLPCFNKKELLKTSYLRFKSSWNNGKFDCDKLFSTNLAEIEFGYFRINGNQIVITNNDNFNFRTDVYNVSGKLLFTKESECECIINLLDFEKGVLIIKSYNHKGNIIVRKIINQ